ncbi:LPS export ABC transporter permease LptF [Rhodobacterales bacterium HKCCE2091]|nr:LPS export ABC transporter permease LptF [Rhodobacterales bacterium HKCCE2091]
MGRYDRYILSQLLVLFGFFSLVLISVYWINQAVDLFDSLLADGQNVAVFLEFTALSLPQIMLLVLPVSAFVAVLYIFNRMISESELVVLQTAGLSPLRLLRPVIVFGLILATLIAVPAHILAPAARTEFNSRSVEVSQDLAGRFLRAGEFIHPADGLTVFIREISEIGEFRDIFLQDRSDPGAETTYTAQRALLVRAEDGPRLVMFDGMAQTRMAEGDRLAVVQFDDFTYDLAQLIDMPEQRTRDIREMPTPFLLRATDKEADLFGSTVLAMRFVAHDRIVKALFAFFIPVIGAATLMTGTFSRFGVWPQILLAVCLVIPLQMIWNVTGTYAERDLSLMWLAYVQPVAAGVVAVAVVIAAGRKRRMRRGGSQAVAA